MIEVRNSSHNFKSNCIDETQAFLKKAYADNKFDVNGKAKAVTTRICGKEIGDIDYFNVGYNAPMRFSSENPRNKFLVLTGLSGMGTYQRFNDSVLCYPGVIIPISAAGNSLVLGGENFSHHSVHIRAKRVNELCEQWTDQPLTDPLLFELRPFSEPLSALWTGVVSAVQTLAMSERVPALVAKNLVDYAVSLMLQYHPHNYTAHMVDSRYLSSAQIEQAKEFMTENVRCGITFDDVASFMGCSIASLHQSFRRYEKTTPRRFLYMKRLECFHKDLGEGGSLDEQIIRSYGVVNVKRFRQLYFMRYGEYPVDTLSRRNSVTDDLRRRSKVVDSVDSFQSLQDWIQKSIFSKITLKTLSELAGVSIHCVITSFKHYLGVTPMQYVISERINRAKWLLDNTTQSLLSIALEVGFSSQSHMTTMFKRNVGLSPRTYRLRGRRNIQT
jgi:transcriptional regulator GlxA family with amidase domain